MTEFDLIILGAGPAGMAAARTAAIGGAKVLLIDEQTSPGGQIYRSILTASDQRLAILGPDYRQGRPLAEALEHANISVDYAATVWRVDEDGSVTYSVDGQARQAKGRHLIVATGALERPTPVPGWTLPGVMTAGAAQILLKSSGVVPERAVLAGSGPLLYLIACQLITAGFPPALLVETQSRSNFFKALKYLPGALRAWSTLAKGRDMLRQISRAGVPRYTGAKDIVISGEDCVAGIAFTAAGRRYDIACQTVLLHSGVVPNTQITRSLRLDHNWDDHQLCFRPRTDAWGGTSNPAVSVAGDGAGIGGATAAGLGGELAALGALEKLGKINAPTRDANAAPLRAAQSRETAIRPFLDTLYRPSDDLRRPVDDVVICRCEEVTAGDIRRYAKLGCTGPNQAKAFGRSGMGPCQGRYCGLTVTELLAEANDLPADDVGYYHIRSPLKPVSLGELASLAEDKTQEE